MESLRWKAHAVDSAAARVGRGERAFSEAVWQATGLPVCPLVQRRRAERAVD